MILQAPVAKSVFFPAATTARMATASASRLAVFRRDHVIAACNVAAVIACVTRKDVTDAGRVSALAK